MSNASTNEVFDCTVEQFYNVVTDYEKYPEFLSEVKQCKVVADNGDHKLVEYHISMIKDFKYRLKMMEETNKKISWILDSGDLFKISNGHWELEEFNGKTKAHYWVEAKFKMFVPGPIAKTVVNINMPNMMKAYHKRLKEIYN